MIPHPLCLWRTLHMWLRSGLRVWISGHDYVTAKDKTPPNVHILVCKTCGHRDIGWSWHSMEQYKEKNDG